MAKQMKRRKAKADKRMVDLRGWAKTFPQIVCGFSWKWQVNFCGCWLETKLTLRSMSGAMRSGNAWAKRMGYKPKWE
jgi:hypothetical protein